MFNIIIYHLIIQVILYWLVSSMSYAFRALFLNSDSQNELDLSDVSKKRIKLTLSIQNDNGTETQVELRKLEILYPKYKVAEFLNEFNKLEALLKKDGFTQEQLYHLQEATEIWGQVSSEKIPLTSRQLNTIIFLWQKFSSGKIISMKVVKLIPKILERLREINWDE